MTAQKITMLMSDGTGGLESIPIENDSQVASAARLRARSRLVQP